MKKLLLITILIVHGCMFIATAQPTTPMLTLNTEMHTGVINGIDTDAEGKYILTVSSDKTAKLWNTQNGELIRTFRVPVGEGYEGLLNAGAISPCGKTVAVGGWSTDIYFFSTATGEILHRLSGLPDAIFDLEFSPDGKYLVACLARKGVRIYSKPEGFENPRGLSLEKSFTNYRDASYNAAWDNTGRLATVCFDGKIRLYDNRFNLIREQSNLSGKEPFSLAFSPDGSLLAIGYHDSWRIQLFDGKTLNLLYEPDVSGANTLDNRLHQVSFSQCGNYLIAGGFNLKYFYGTRVNHIRVWTNKGRDSYNDYPVWGNTIMDIKPLANNDFIFAGAHPGFARVSIYGNSVFYKEKETNRLATKIKLHFKINQSGNTIGVTPLYEHPLVFDVAGRALYYSDPNSDPTGLNSHTENHAGIRITDWDTQNPKINNHNTSFLENFEWCHSADIAPDGKKIVFGASWNIYCTDAGGRKLWEATLQSAAWAVNISGNGKTVVAAHGDGIIRWYCMYDGKLLMSLFLHPDNQRWVLWSPEGYFDCAPGAEDLIGWHLNQGKDKAALFYPASRFRSTFYRPDIIDKILQTYNTKDAVRLANQESYRHQQDEIILNFPPSVRIFSPTEGQTVKTNNLTIEYSATSPGKEPIAAIRVLIDGRPAEEVRGLKLISDSSRPTVNVTIPSRDVNVSVMAQNTHGWSTPASINLKWEGTQEQDLLKPTLYILSVGVSKYKNPDFNLGFAAKDAQDFLNTMLDQKGALYGDVQYRLLTDDTASKDNMLEGLDWLQKQTTSRDIAMLFIAGHGINDNQGTFYFMPHQADPNSLRRTCLMFSEIKYTTASIAGKVLVFIDACHSGNVMGSTTRAPNLTNLVNELTDAESGAIVFTSSTGRQYSLENPVWGNGAFTKALVEGLNGKADLFNNKTITIKTLDAYIANRVKELTSGQQAPTAIIPQSIPDFPIGIVK